MPLCLLGLGSNLGNRAALLRAAVQRLEQTSSTRIVSRSGLHETSPIGGPRGQEAFLNAAVLVETSLPPDSLLAIVGRIETELGRQRNERWGPRTVDIDLLIYDDLIQTTETLQLPHPRMAWRRFILVPAAEAAPSMRHPRIGWTIRELLDHLNTTKPYLALAGPAGSGKRELAQSAAGRLGGVAIADPSSDLHPGCDETNRYSLTPQGELEFAEQRAKAVASDSPRWSEPCSVWISDFWVGQSAAVIQAFSDEPRRGTFLQRWRTFFQQTCPTRLTVLLDAPSAWCVARLAERGIPLTAAEELDKIHRIRRALAGQFAQPGFGPVLELDARRPDNAIEELLAAVAAMEDKRSSS